jgi:hydrogenase nickel incorporation protein HypA/HybF
MHELSIALSLVELAETEANRLGGRVRAVHVRVGALAGVVQEALRSSYEIACADTALAGSRLVIKEVPIVVYCERCKAERSLPSMQWFCCSVCGTPTPDVRQGKELELAALELEP